jgi:hypothetical protein
MSPKEMSGAIARSRYVVCHAGSGIISSVLRVGRKPLVLARRRANKEHVDDHQMQIVEKLAEMGLVVPIEEEITADDLSAADMPLGQAARAAFNRLPNIEEALSEALHTVLGSSANSSAGTTLVGERQRPGVRPGQPTEKERGWT